MVKELDSLRDRMGIHHTGYELDHHSTTSNSSDPRHRAPSRQKRFLSYPRYVELMLTADVKMARHHGRNLEHYILTIMSVVSKIYIFLIIKKNTLLNLDLFCGVTYYGFRKCNFSVIQSHSL